MKRQSLIQILERHYSSVGRLKVTPERKKKLFIEWCIKDLKNAGMEIEDDTITLLDLPNILRERVEEWLNTDEEGYYAAAGELEKILDRLETKPRPPVPRIDIDEDEEVG